MREDHGIALVLQPLDLAEEIEPSQTGGLNRHFCLFGGASALGFLDRILIWGRKVDVARLVGAFRREARYDLHVVEAGSEERHRKATLDGLSGRLPGQLHRTAAVACLRRSWTAGRDWSHRALVGVGERGEHAAAAISLDRVNIDVGAGDIDFRQLDL